MGLFKKKAVDLGPATAHEVPKKELLQYMAGITGQNLNCGIIMGFLFYFCTDILYISPAWVGTALAVIKIWDALNDPVAGTLIDRHLFKNGEKMRPILKYTTIPIGILSAIMFFGIGLGSGDEKGKMTAFAILMIAYFFYGIFYTFQDIAQWGMTSLMATTSEERGRVSQWGRIGATLGSLPPQLIPVFTGLVMTASGIVAARRLFAVFGILFGLGGMLLATMAHGAKERVPAKKVEGHPFEPLKLLFKNKLVMLVTLSQTLTALTLSLSQLQFFKYLVNVNIGSFHMDGMTFNIVFGAIIGVPAMVSMVFTSKLAKKIGGMKNLLMIVPISNLVCRLLIFAFVREFSGFGIIITGLLLAVAYVPGGMQGIAMTTLWGDSLDKIEYETGSRNEASVFAMQNLVSKLGGAIGTFFAGITLTILKYDPETIDKAVENGEKALDVITRESPTFLKYAWPVFILAPALGSLFALIPLLFIKYNVAEQKKIETALKERHGKEAAALAMAAATVDLGAEPVGD